MRNGLRRFRRFLLRRLLQERIRSAVTVLGIALGIAVIVGIRMTNASSVRGFEAALETVSGKTSLEIVGPGAGTGFDEMALTSLGWLRRYGDVSPVVEGDALAATADGASESLRILGLDMPRDRSRREFALVGENDALQPAAREFLDLLLDAH